MDNVLKIPLFSFTIHRYTIDEDNSLKIKKLTMDDSAMFQCLASNEAGEKSSYTWLRVKSKYNDFSYYQLIYFFSYHTYEFNYCLRVIIL